MSLLESIFKEEKKEHTLGVCVPEHARVKQEEANREVVEKIKAAHAPRKKQSRGEIRGAFRVSGLYVSGETVMLRGRVTSGEIKNKMRTEIRSKKISVKELQRGKETVKTLHAGDEGAIYLDRVGASLKLNDLIEFW